VPLYFVALQKRRSEINVKAADMWSFAVLLWELATREVPFADLSPMESGLKVSDLKAACTFNADFLLPLLPLRLK